MNGPTMHVQVRKDLNAASGNRKYAPSVLIGSRVYTPADGPIELDSRVAERLIKEGTVSAVVQLPGARLERAVSPKLEAARR